jgi:DUF971 family protein
VEIESFDSRTPIVQSESVLTRGFLSNYFTSVFAFFQMSTLKERREALAASSSSSFMDSMSPLTVAAVGVGALLLGGWLWWTSRCPGPLRRNAAAQRKKKKKTDEKHFIFGKKGSESVAQMQMEIQEKQKGLSGPLASAPVRLYEIPIWEGLSESSDMGDPFFLASGAASSPSALKDSPVRRIYSEMAAQVWQSLTGSATSQHSSTVPTVKYDQPSDLMVMMENGVRSTVPPRSLRLACQCAACVDEHTGVSRMKPDRIPSDVRPLGIQPRGNYAVAVHWSDGHASSIYPFEQIKAVAARSQQSTQQ